MPCTVRAVSMTKGFPASVTSFSRQVLWLALSMTPQMGATRCRRLTEHFGGVEQVFHASLTELEAAGLHAVSAQSINNRESLVRAEEELVRAATAGASIIGLDDPNYPPLLRQIYDPPVALYVCGGAAIVGTRHPTPYGIGMAERLACDLASRGLVIFSGLARGIDSAGHRGAINAKGKTAAVLGTGVDVIYPRENNRLAESILGLGG